MQIHSASMQAGAGQAGADPVEAAAWALVDLTVFVVRQTAVLRDISLSAAATLGTLDTSGPCHVSDLAERERTSQPTITAMVIRLEQAGLVQRHADPHDGRAVLVSITDAGRAMLRRRRVSQAAFLASLIERLPASERDGLLAATAALRSLSLLGPASVDGALEAARRAAAAGGASR